ncbi:phosphatidylserine decarboxylase [Exidia glandulosa HHB12029]|uniref:Phosphatidylserine decarboxylase proenzyme 1, mitochondrial n=1 Tax=Exidia glandulosa HHB12029 TaxID=1314781 RepID=A0A165EZE9_EXIGL|nr:phosphatidylserine decarboxylase [Exidia glandulosa HHB12029]
MLSTLTRSSLRVVRLNALGRASRAFHASCRRLDDKKYSPLYRRLADAWRDTPTKWYPLPIGIGALLLVVLNYRKNYSSKEVVVDGDGNARRGGRWGVHVLGALPLRNLSRLWGYLNSLTLPVWFRPYGFRLYAWVFGCNLDEMAEQDLKHYTSLGDFFYRSLKDGVRPIASTALVSPADGKILHFGTVEGARVEQVKGITYSLDALLGSSSPSNPVETVPFTHGNPDARKVSDEQFADVNGIPYSLDDFLGRISQTRSVEGDASVPSASPSSALDVGVRVALGSKEAPTKSSRLFFCVIYLAPGDYHRFHSPTAWVVERRRHFSGELFSVSPFVAQRLQDLFVLNERVALLGRWRYGFFSMIPVGATNVGSIKINFDQALRTNVRGRLPPPGTFREATYSGASTLLSGQPLVPGEEMGGFCLGSSIVLVFEAPDDFVWKVHAGQKVKYGEVMGDRAVVFEEEEKKLEKK